MTKAQRNERLGNINFLQLTADDALFYRARIDELHAIINALVEHYDLPCDYEEDIAVQRPNEKTRNVQDALLFYADGLIEIINCFIYSDIIMSGADESFYQQHLPRLDFVSNFPPRFREGNLITV